MTPSPESPARHSLRGDAAVVTSPSIALSPLGRHRPSLASVRGQARLDQARLTCPTAPSRTSTPKESAGFPSTMNPTCAMRSRGSSRSPSRTRPPGSGPARSSSPRRRSTASCRSASSRGSCRTSASGGKKQAKQPLAPAVRSGHDDDDRHRGFNWSRPPARRRVPRPHRQRSGHPHRRRGRRWAGPSSRRGPTSSSPSSSGRDLRSTPRSRSSAISALAARPSAATVRVRIGIHTGEPSVSEGNYIGMDVHAAARICAVSHGGQIVVSGATRDAVGRDTVEMVRYRSLGAQRLRRHPRARPALSAGCEGLGGEVSAAPQLVTVTRRERGCR